MLRVAILCEFGSVNGGERSMLAALAALRGVVKPLFLAPPTGGLAEALGEAGWDHIPFDVRDTQGIRKPGPSLARELTQMFSTLDVDLLHANSLSMSRLTGQVAGQLGLPCCGHLRDIVRLSAAAVRDLNRNSQLLAVSAATRDFHVAQGCDAQRVSVLYNGVDLTEFQPPTDGSARFDLRRRLRLSDDAFLALTIGQIGMRKGLDVLARAAPGISDRIPQVHFLIVGERHSQKDEAIAYERELAASFERAGLAGRCSMLGRREDIPDLMRGADVLVHPARQEPLGRVLLEGAACGMAIVATRVGGTEEILSDGETARLVRPDDPAALSAAVVEMASDAGLRQRLGANARASIATRFGIEERARELLAQWQMVQETR